MYMLKYNSVGWGGERRTFPRNCQKLHWNPLWCLLLDCLRQMREVPASSYLCLLQSIGKCVILLAIYPLEAVTPRGHSNAQCDVNAETMDRDMSVHTAFSISLEALPTVLATMSVSPTFDLRYMLDIPGLHLVYITYEGLSWS